MLGFFCFFFLFQCLFLANTNRQLWWEWKKEKNNTKQHNNLYLQLSETKLWWISAERQSHCTPTPSSCTHTHTHTYNCCSQGNMKGPGRYRDILGPLIYLPWPGAPALSKCQQKIMHTQRQSYLFKNRSRSPQFSQATQRDKRRQYTATKSRCLLFIQLLAFLLNISSVFYPFLVFIFALCKENTPLPSPPLTTSVFLSLPPLLSSFFRFPPHNQFHFDCVDECIPPHYVLPWRGR